ncbi:MAG: deoxyribodipyrimidine photo-lyase, partial [Siculibacillus sp.]|nr:deoxyribodipyrimidine photo-lyase [Siculibacillus sp.]
MPTRDDVRPLLLWLRDDLRLADNPALDHAAASGREMVAVFVLDEVSPNFRPLGGASKWWLARSLAVFFEDFARIGGRLVLRRGAGGEVVREIAEEIDAAEVVWNRRYLPAMVEVDAEAKRRLREAGRRAVSFAATLLHEPQTVKTGGGGAFRVFTPFWRACRGGPPPRAPLARPETVRGASRDLASLRLCDLDLLPTKPDWAGGLERTWTPGEAGAAARLARFLDVGLPGYATRRDRPDLDICSHLSPHLRFGEISPHLIVDAVKRRVESDPSLAADADKFLAELGWREFAH